MNPIKVLLADDTVLAREGWKRIIETADDIVVIGETTTAQETPGKVQELKPDLVLMDLKWYGDTTAGWIAIREIKRKTPAVKVIGITAYEELAREAKRAGAEGILLKDFTKDELLGLIRALHTAEDDFGAEWTGPTQSLDKDLPSARELEVLALMDQGLSDKEIAEKLVISDSTAKNHVRNILSKLGAKNRTQAAKLAREKGLLG